MKRKSPIALKTGNRVICWSEDYHRLLPVVVTKVNAKSFQGETSAGDKVNAISKLQAWSLKEFEKDYPEEFYRLFPNKLKEQSEQLVKEAEATEVVSSVQDDIDDNTINGHLPPVEKLAEHDFSVGDRITWQGGNFTIQKVTAEAILIVDADNFSTWIRNIKDIERSNSWNPDDFGELEFLPEPDGQLNLLEPLTNEPPDPDDFADLNQYETAWKAWKANNKAVWKAKENLPTTSDSEEPKSNSMEENYTKEENNNNGGVTNLRIDAIEVLEEMQPRMFGLNFEAVNQYCDRIQNGEQPPPVIVYQIKETPMDEEVEIRQILVAGFHRVAAAKQAGKPYISAIIKQGTWAEAKLEAATNNKNNGLQMGNQDIGKAINLYLLGLEELPENDLRRRQSLREIANAIGCSHTYVSKVKSQIAFEQKVKEFNLVKGARFKHKELGSCGTIFACYKTSESIILEWDISDGNRYSGQLSVNDFLKDFEATDLPKQEAAPTVNSVQNTFTKAEDETKAKAKSLGLSSSKNGVLPECKDNGDGKCLNVDRNTPPELDNTTEPTKGKESDEQYTPKYVWKLGLEMLGIKSYSLDPCTNDVVNPNVPASSLYSKNDDGLSVKWNHKSVWLNPPYSNPQPWIEKAIAEYEAGNIDHCFILVSSDNSTKWYQKLLKYPVCLVDHRIKFLNPDNTGSARFACSLFYLGENLSQFFLQFDTSSNEEGLGTVIYKDDDGNYADDLTIGILSNVKSLRADHIKSLFDAIASRIPDELLIEEAQKRSAVAA